MAHFRISPHVDVVMAEVEASLLGIVERAAPWLAAIPNAVFVARATSKLFDIPEPMALLIAAGLEVAAHKVTGGWLDAKGWNARKGKTDERAPEWRWLGYLVAIFALDILMVAALAVPNYLDTGDLRQLFVLTYPLIGIVTTIALGESVEQHKRELRSQAAKAERQRKRQEARQKRQAEKRRQSRRAKAEAKAAITAPRTAAMIAENETLERAKYVYATNPGITGSALGRKLGLSERQGRNLKVEIEAEISGNGHG